MRVLLSIAIVFLTAPFISASDADSLLMRLDRAIDERQEYVARKEAVIVSLKRALGQSASPAEKSELLDKIYNEYLPYSFDSTMVYLREAEALTASPGAPRDAAPRVRIHKAFALATSGHFSQAAAILGSIDAALLPTQLRREYYSACEWTYGVWAEYSGDHDFAPQYKSRSLQYLDSLLAISEPGTPDFSYRLAEKALRTGDYGLARTHYLDAIRDTPVNTRLYAQISYALAVACRNLGDNAGYREWLIRSAISDQVTPLKENLALQQLALLLKEEGGDLERANRYLRIALDDAIFYNNRLRMLEIAEKFPDIANEYQDTINSRNSRLMVYLWIIGVMLVAMLLVAWILKREVKKKRNAISALNDMTRQLEVANGQLRSTNVLREQYTSLFVDLCAAYIDKLNRFPTVLKVKVKQLSDLTSVADRYVRPSEAELREMFFNFDTAFLRLYPDFIERFNSLLQPDKQIYPKDREHLNTDLRIYALVRMGITDSNRIASLLFMSPQTIFNHRTSVRNRALDRATFEHDVRKICSIIPAE